MYAISRYQNLFLSSHGAVILFFFSLKQEKNFAFEKKLVHKNELGKIRVCVV